MNRKPRYQFGIMHTSASMMEAAKKNPNQPWVVRGGSNTHTTIESATAGFLAMCEEAHAAPSKQKWTWTPDDRVSLVTARGKVLAEMIPLR